MSEFNQDLLDKCVHRMRVEMPRQGEWSWKLLLDNQVVALCPSKAIANSLGRGLVAWMYLQEEHDLASAVLNQKIQGAIDESLSH